MDVNGTKFHLVHLKKDWEPWWSVRHQVTLAELFDPANDFPDAEIEWNAGEGNLRLARQAVQFQPSATQPDTNLDNRRGAGRDRYGHWYWITEDKSGIYFLAQGERTPVIFWSSAAADACDPADVPDRGQFHSREPAAPQPLTLSGLAVTAGHYLAVGVWEQGLLIFDLHRGGPPVLLLWTMPAGQMFHPWDLAATPDGGMLVLDRDNARYWRLNRHFQLATTLPGEADPPPETIFQDQDLPPDAEPRRVCATVPHVGYELPGDADNDPPADPISIESGPDDSVLILDGPDTGPSAVYEYVNETLRAVYPLTYSVSHEDGSTESRDLHAHDFAYLHHTPENPTGLLLQVVEDAEEDEELHLLFVARRDGNQVIAYQLFPDEPGIEDLPDYLPLRRWQEKGLVAAGNLVYYDFEQRWIPLAVFLDCVYATSAVIESPTDFERAYWPGEPPGRYSLKNGIPEQPFDSNIPGCVWHRLLLDAEIPPGTQVLIKARAADDPASLTLSPWIDQPRPYQRSDGAELPYFDPYHGRRDDPTLTERAGTWEILFQAVTGRYLQVQLTLLGTGRATPEIRSVRLWYPRFSYRDHYLPAIYSEEPVSASLTERLLANFEGFYTTLEDRIVQLSSLLDPRTTPTEALDWLADWLGVVLHPLWEEWRRRFFIRFAHRLYQMRGTVPGVIVALRIFLDEELDESLFDPDCILRSNIRIVEHFLTRDFAGTIFGDPTGETPTALTVAEAAHRFSVLLPYQLQAPAAVTGEALRMAERIIELEKPAHTWFDIKEYWNMFRVGEARLGLDTRIGHSTYFQPLVLGDAILPHTTLGCPYPLDIQDRFVMGRNTVQLG
jgi:phage tail-like protein